ncbi:partitioning defective 3 homolog B-like [Clupea harengus]|uniref:Partitioning defective 3 homolog B-like n=1 Tax=Clupea harengus TaxID=7950 RepID=A0A6P8FZM0_CLUHA|nr:partitioning defective 3 homolog B-like [Clupea harengus]
MSHALMDKPLTDGTNSNASPYTPSLTRTVEISGEKGPLGIHVVPFCSSLSGRTLGLHIRGVEENSRSKREGIFHDDECIVRINDTELMDKTFTQSQEVFRQAMRSPTVRLEVVPVGNRERYEKSIIGSLLTSPDPPTDGPPTTKKTPPPVKVKPTLRPPPGETTDGGGGGGGAGVLEVRGSPGTQRPPSRLSPNPKGRSESPLLRKSLGLPPLAGLTGKKGGKKLRVDLKKGEQQDSGHLMSHLENTQKNSPGVGVISRTPKRIAPDGRLRVNDQLVAVNGESLLGKSNHEAMETLRRSMSNEGNLRGLIQLLVLRPLLQTSQEQAEVRRTLNRSFDSCTGHMSAVGQANRPAQAALVLNSLYQRADFHSLSNGGYGLTEEGHHEEDGTLLRSQHEADLSSASPPGAAPNTSSDWESGPGENSFRSEAQGQVEHHHVKSSKSMDLVADESNVGALTGQKPVSSLAQALGPTLGLKKSSSLESLQTAVSEAQRVNQQQQQQQQLLPFHRPRPHMVRGRGCNESFRAAIDKSYDGPPEDDDDDFSDQSSGRDTPASSSSRLGDAEEGKKDKKKKTKGKKKDKMKAKGKEKEREKEKEKKKEDGAEELDKKSKKKGFALLRFGKKKETKTLIKHTADILSEEELERMKEERERIEAKHQELRDRQARDRYPTPDMEDDAMDPNYARIHAFRVPSSPPLTLRTHTRSPSPQSPPRPPLHPPGPHLHAPGPPVHSREPSGEDALDGLYAKVNKQRAPAPAPSTDRPDRQTDRERFGKKKETKTLIKHTADILSEEELERMKEERERIEAKHQELRDRQARDRYPTPDMEDDAMDPNYARIHAFRVPSSPPLTLRTHTRSPSPQSPPRPPLHPPGPPLHAPGPPVHSREPSGEDALDGLYAKVNKQRAPAPAPSTDRPDRQTDRESMDRIQQLRREYQQARREGAAPAYEDLESRRRGPEYDPHRVSAQQRFRLIYVARSPNGSPHVLGCCTTVTSCRHLLPPPPAAATADAAADAERR